MTNQLAETRLATQPRAWQHRVGPHSLSSFFLGYQLQKRDTRIACLLFFDDLWLGDEVYSKVSCRPFAVKFPDTFSRNLLLNYPLQQPHRIQYSCIRLLSCAILCL